MTSCGMAFAGRHKEGALQAIMDTLGEGSHIYQNLLGLDTPSAELKLLFLLLLQSSALVDKLLTPARQLLQAENPSLMVAP